MVIFACIVIYLYVTALALEVMAQSTKLRVLRMYDVEKRSAVLENADFARRDAYIYGPVTKWRQWGMLIH